jgi:hypothetical protein
MGEIGEGREKGASSFYTVEVRAVPLELVVVT